MLLRLVLLFSEMIALLACFQMCAGSFLKNNIEKMLAGKIFLQEPAGYVRWCGKIPEIGSIFRICCAAFPICGSASFQNDMLHGWKVERLAMVSDRSTLQQRANVRNCKTHERVSKPNHRQVRAKHHCIKMNRCEVCSHVRELLCSAVFFDRW